LIYSHSVFTHLSEKTHKHCLQTLTKYLQKDGVLVITVRPKKYLAKNFKDEKIRNELLTKFENNSYAFQPHKRKPVNGEFVYGDCAFSLEYIQKNWSKLFSILDYHTNFDPFQDSAVLKKL